MLGGSQQFSSMHMVGEFIVDDSHLLLYLEEELQVSSRTVLDIRSYMYLNRFSASLDCFMSTDVDKHVRMDLGAMFFFGKEERFFSHYDTLKDNDNKIYLKLLFSF